eukprot:CAMPEP_0115319750 /NCGR_PEP_ID=MMETSP0270-20121206/79945_1 /TAXON_ID=71861 /ORGANISM="Scrippsiella trochoidea, Strain CCMP3099" /LENGTH=125 /DNA_ID=CAMNT_0002739489 /DNA_START=42 /DNA_END=416 /DNA_ORIENTATION=-
MKKLQDASGDPDRSFDGFRIYERHICTYFLPVSHLRTRFRTLRALHSSDIEEKELTHAISIAKAAYNSVLATPCSPQICEEVKAFLAIWLHVTNKNDLAALASVGISKVGRALYERCWRNGDKLQ